MLLVDGHVHPVPAGGRQVHRVRPGGPRQPAGRPAGRPAGPGRLDRDVRQGGDVGDVLRVRGRRRASLDHYPMASTRPSSPTRPTPPGCPPISGRRLARRREADGEDDHGHGRRPVRRHAVRLRQDGRPTGAAGRPGRHTPAVWPTRPPSPPPRAGWPHRRRDQPGRAAGSGHEHSLPVLAGITSTTIFAASTLPMLVKACRSRDCRLQPRQHRCSPTSATPSIVLRVQPAARFPCRSLDLFYLLSTGADADLVRHVPRRRRRTYRGARSRYSVNVRAEPDGEISAPRVAPAGARARTLPARLTSTQGDVPQRRGPRRDATASTPTYIGLRDHVWGPPVTRR